MLQGEDCHLALLMTILAQAEAPPGEWQDKPLPPPRPGGKERLSKETSTGKDNVGDRPVRRGGREPLQSVTVFTQVEFARLQYIPQESSRWVRPAVSTGEILCDSRCGPWRLSW